MGKKITLNELQQKVANFQGIISSIGDGISIQDTDFNILYQNQAHKNMIGDHLGEHCFTAYENNENVCEGCPVKQTFRDGNVHTAERTVEVDGEILYVEITASPLKSASGEIIAGIESVRNITKRKKAEILLNETLKKLDLRVKERTAELEHEIEERKKNEERFRDISLSMADWIWEVDCEGKYVYASGKVKNILGYLPEELLGKTPFDFMLPDEAEMVERIFNQLALEHKPIVDLINWNLTKDGKVVCLLTNGVPIFGKSGKLTGYRGVDKDITELKLAEDSIQRSEKKYRDLVEGTDDLITVVDVRGGITFINHMSEKYLGRSPDELIGASAFQFIHPDDRKMTEKWFKDCLNQKLPSAVIENRQVNQKTGEVFWMSWTSSFFYDEQGKLESVSGISRDITERKKIEVALLESEERFRALMHQSPAVIELYDSDGLQVEVNEAYELLWGFPASHTVNKFNVLKSKEVVDTGLIDYVKRAYAGEAVKVPAYRFDSTGKTEGKGKGRVRWLSTRIYPLKDRIGDVQHVVITHEDVSEIKFAEQEKENLELRLHQTYKMEAIGTMAGGIAHDFNNILSIILGNADIALDDIPAGNSARHNIDQILYASRRAKDLVKQILTFSRQADHKLLPLKPYSVIKESLKLLRSTTPKSVDIIQNLCGGQDGVTIMADATQLHQLLMNLFSNSIEAMDEKGTLEVSCDVVSLNTDDIAHQPDLKSGQYFKLSVGDTGSGITKETRERMFDPFYTTKEVDKGTGMGLSIVMGIVLGHGGMITVDGVPGEGTTFNMFFPIAETEKIQQTEVPGQLSQGNERILFVDDEKMVAEMGSTMLERQGYKVTSTTSSIDALETFKSDPEAFDLVITDQTMPNMSGAELAIELLKIRSNIPIILCTGYSKKISEKEAKVLGIREFLLKPFDRRQLAKSVREVLGKNDAP